MATITESRNQPSIALKVPSSKSGLHVGPKRFMELCRLNPDLRLERAADGELIVMAPASPDSSERNAELVFQLVAWNKRTGLGSVFESSAGFTHPNTAVRAPDATWVQRDRWKALSQEERERFSRLVPDFVAEIRSKTDSLPELRKKMREYIEQGVRLGWLIDPRKATVEVYRPGSPVEMLDRPATISGEDVLPGFVLDLKGILFD